MHVIIPAARPSHTKPPYLWYDYEHQMMLSRAIAPYLGKCQITVGILRDHDLKYSAVSYIHNEHPSVNVVILDQVTTGPAETVYKMLEMAKITDDQPILIRDSDTFFDHSGLSGRTGNYVCVADVSNFGSVSDISSKSFVQCNESGIITNITEKAVISPIFCVGGYKFEDAGIYRKFYNVLANHTRRIHYVSHVVYLAIMEGVVFETDNVANFKDVGTIEAWNKHNDHPVIFCDIDGTLIEAQGRYGPNNYDTLPIPIAANVKRLLDLQFTGAQFVFVTARPKKYTDVTQKMLTNLGFKNFSLITGLNNSRRILINDYNELNPYPRASAINIPRNSGTLKDFL